MRIKILTIILFLTLCITSPSFACPVDIIPTKSVYHNESIKFRLITDSKESQVTYWIEDSFGNILKAPRNTTNSNLKSYSPKLSGINPYLLKATSGDCQNISEEWVIHIKNMIDHNDSSENIYPSKKELIYSIEHSPKIIYADNFNVKIYLSNYGPEKDVTLWAYVYRGSKSYTTNDNTITLRLDTNSDRIIDLPVHVNASPGEYKLKVKINHSKLNQLTSEIEIKSLNLAALNLELENNGQTISACVNNTYKSQKIVKVIFSTSFETYEKSFYVKGLKTYCLNYFPEEVYDTMPVFAKLYHEDKLVDVEEIILISKKQHNLLLTDVILNNSRTTYVSPASISFTYAPYILLLISFLLNVKMLWFSKDDNS